MIRLRQLGPAFIRHLEAYGLLAVAAGRDLRTLAMQRAALAFVGAVLGIALVVLLGATLIAAGWDTAWRGWIAAGVLGALALGSFACVAAARADLPDSTHLQALKDEWRKDRAWLASRGRSNTPSPRYEDPAVPSGGGTRRTVETTGRAGTKMHGT